jgi:hypothetical protein
VFTVVEHSGVENAAQRKERTMYFVNKFGNIHREFEIGDKKFNTKDEAEDFVSDMAGTCVPCRRCGQTIIFGTCCETHGDRSRNDQG